MSPDRAVPVSPPLARQPFRRHRSLTDVESLGRTDALARLHQRHYPELVRLGFALTGDWGLAEELAQEAFVRTWQRWNAIRRPEAAPAYLRTTVVNLARSGARMRLREIRAWLAVPTRAPGEPDVSTDVVRALAQLPRRKRECVVLRYYPDLSEAHTAAVLGVTVGTIKSQTAKALRRLQPLLTDTSAMQGTGSDKGSST